MKSNAEGFHSLEELQAAYPPRYDFFTVVYGADDLESGRYDLGPLTRLPTDQVNIIAVPRERSFAS